MDGIDGWIKFATRYDPYDYLLGAGSYPNQNMNSVQQFSRSPNRRFGIAYSHCRRCNQCTEMRPKQITLKHAYKKETDYNFL